MVSVPRDERVARLPIWAQQEITDLRNKVEHLQRALSTITGATEPAPFWVDTEPCDWKGEHRFYLQQSRVSFSADPVGSIGDYSKEVLFLMRREEGDRTFLEIQGRRELCVRPRASNCLYVEI